MKYDLEITDGVSIKSGENFVTFPISDLSYWISNLQILNPFGKLCCAVTKVINEVY